MSHNPIYRSVLVLISIFAVTLGPVASARQLCERLLEPGRIYPISAPSSLVEFAEEVALTELPSGARYAKLRPGNARGRLALIAHVLSQKGVKFEMADGGRFWREPKFIEVSVGGPSHLNRVAKKLKDLYGIRVRFDPRKVPHMHNILGASDLNQDILYLSEYASLTGRPDRTFYHEVKHLTRAWREEQGRTPTLNGWYQRPAHAKRGWPAQASTYGGVLFASEAVTWEQDYLAARNVYKTLLHQPRLLRADVELFTRGLDFEILDVLRDLKYLAERTLLASPSAWSVKALPNHTLLFSIRGFNGLSADHAVSRASIETTLLGATTGWSDQTLANYFNRRLNRDQAWLVLANYLELERQHYQKLIFEISQENKRVELMRSSLARGLTDLQTRALLTQTFALKPPIEELVREWRNVKTTSIPFEQLDPRLIERQSQGRGVEAVAQNLAGSFSQATVGEVRLGVNGLREPLRLRWAGAHVRDVFEYLDQIADRGLIVTSSEIVALRPFVDQEPDFLNWPDHAEYTRLSQTERDSVRVENQARVIGALDELNLNF